MNLVDAIDVALTGIGGEVTGVSRAKILSLRYVSDIVSSHNNNYEYEIRVKIYA